LNRDMPRHVPLALALLLLAGCPGEMDLSSLPLGHIDGGAGQTFSYDDASTISAPLPDTGAPTADGTVAADTMAPDTMAPDTLQPDTGVAVPTGVGKPCPCDNDLICINGACRAKCNAPTGACGVTSNCPADQACVQTTGGFYVCVPATKPGSACNASAFCPVNYVCGSVSGSAYTCLPLCTGAGTACGTSGTGKCAQAQNGCSFCSSI